MVITREFDIRNGFSVSICGKAPPRLPIETSGQALPKEEGAID